MTPSHARRQALTNGSGHLQNRYRSDAYRRAIERACDKTFPPPAELQGSQRAAWQKAHRWSPNRLRHATATVVRGRFGLEAAQLVLGHASADVSQIYAERDFAKAAAVMNEIG